MAQAFDNTLELVRKEIKRVNPKVVDSSKEAIAYVESRTFTDYYPNYLQCPENAAIMNRWLRERDLEPTFPNLKQAYTELMEAGMLHTTPPDPSPRNHVPAKRAPYRFTGSYYDRTQVNRLKADMAQMSAQELREMQTLNGWWPDFPPALKA